MDYLDYNDSELLSYICENNEEASEIIYRKYKPVITSIARGLGKYCTNTGIDVSDLIQEGLIALDTAINSFDEQKDITFSSFVRVCIQRRMISLINNSNAQKHKILNGCLSLDFVYDEDDNKLSKTVVDNRYNPENLFMNEHQVNTLIEEAKEKLTDLELAVFELKIYGLSYQEISTILDLDFKAIDNAIQRLRKKLKKNNIISF